MSQLTAPFKFLDSYKQEDNDIFFGREKETNDLYQALSGVKHLLVYGPSGAGKTSLVECGLRNQFSDADWFALTIRRGADIAVSVFSEINKALREKMDLDPETKLPLDPETDFGQAIERLFSERYQPVYLLFDQFEELLISGSDAEKRGFFTRLNQLIRYKVPCRVMLIMREEFIGHLSEFEPLCPSIFQHRFRLEKMRKENVKEVIRETLDAAHYRSYFRVEDSAQLAESILSKLPDLSREIELAHVQVFLSELWDRASDEKKNDALPMLREGLIKDKDDLAGVLDSFLNKQLDELDPIYGEKAPLEALAAMISDRHTKLQMSVEALQKDLDSKDVVLKKPLSKLLRDLEQRRILRTIKSGEQTQYEISHDVLALVVGQNLTKEMQLRAKAADIYNVYEERKGLFSREDLDYIRPYQQYKAYPPELERRIKESETYLHAEELRIQREKDEQLEAAMQQAEKEKALADKATRALEELREKNKSIFESFSGLGISMIYNLDHDKALEKMQVAVEIDVDHGVKKRELIEPISELLFFFAEGGRRPALARMAAQLLLQLSPEAGLEPALRQCVQEGWSTRSQFEPLLRKLPSFQKNQERYYPELISVPLGTDGIFEMGSDSAEWKHQSNEQLHQIQLSEYKISATPITFYQFALFCEAMERGLASRTPYWGRFGDHPVVNVNWYETLEYANWLNGLQGATPAYEIQKVTNSDPDSQVQNDFLKWKVSLDAAAKGFRLPTEAEWELAARAGVGAPRTLFAGSDTLDTAGWFWENSGDKPLSGDWDLNRIYDNNGRTHPVKAKKDNGIGIYDMSGNVFEWCWDWYDAGYYNECQKQGVVSSPAGAKSSTSGRVLRGGSWSSNAGRCRTANRFNINPDNRYNFIGFRLVFVP